MAEEESNKEDLTKTESWNMENCLTELFKLHHSWSWWRNANICHLTALNYKEGKETPEEGLFRSSEYEWTGVSLEDAAGKALEDVQTRWAEPAKEE